MKTKSLLFLLLIAIFFGCKNQPQRIEITPNILISVPQKSKISINGSDNTLKKWEIAFGDDQFAVFKYSINEQDSANAQDQKNAFKNNIDAFIQVFDLKNLDSTFTYRDTFSQSDLSFDYLSNGNKYKFFGRFLANKQNFIAICFQTPFPVDNFSKRTKDNLFNSIEIK